MYVGHTCTHHTYMYNAIIAKLKTATPTCMLVRTAVPELLIYINGFKILGHGPHLRGFPNTHINFKMLGTLLFTE